MVNLLGSYKSLSRSDLTSVKESQLSKYNRSPWKFVEFIESELRWKSVELMELKEAVYQKKLSHADAQGGRRTTIPPTQPLLLLLPAIDGPSSTAHPPPTA